MRRITIQIGGEPGTGKSQLAERLHHILNGSNVPHHVNDSRSPNIGDVTVLRLPADVEVIINVQQHGDFL